MVAENDLLTIEEAAKKYHVKEVTVRTWYRRGKIKKYRRRIDGAVFVKASEIDAAFEVLPADEDDAADS